MIYKYFGGIIKFLHVPKCAVNSKSKSLLSCCRNLTYSSTNRLYQFQYKSSINKDTSLCYVQTTFHKYRDYSDVGKENIKTDLNEFVNREKQREKEFKNQEENGKPQQENIDTENDIKAVRSKILESALLHVPTLGWTRNAIMKGAEELGYCSTIHGMFPEGGFSLVSYFTTKCNNELVQQMQAEIAVKQQNNDARDENSFTNQMEFLIRFVRIRLEMLIPYKNQWAQALSLTALPQNTSTSLAQLLTLVDDICYYSGDRSVDIAWYTRRIGLATIFRMTEFYLLQDNSPQHVKTWEFLKNRTYEMGQVQNFFNQTEDVTQTLQKSLNSAFLTARNILGLGYNRS